MSESEKTAESSASFPDTNGLAIDLAMEEARNELSLKDHVAAFFNDQRALIADQRHHMHKHLSLGLWEKRLGVLLRIATAFTGLAIAAGLAFLIWDASQSNRLMVESFSVPPELVGRGLTGEVIAAKVLDRIGAIQAQTVSNRAPKSFANNWSQQDLKIDIPETGLSLSQLDNFLREKLGNDTHVTGEAIRTQFGLSLTARAGADVAESVSGAESDLDSLVQRLAESLYKKTQPYLFAVYLGQHGRADEAVSVFKDLAENGPVQERAWAYIGWGLLVRDTEGVDRALDLLGRAVELAPDSYAALYEFALQEANKGWSERGLQDSQKAVQLLSGSTQTTLRPGLVPSALRLSQAAIDNFLGDFHAAVQKYAENVRDPNAQKVGLSTSMAVAQISEHDVGAARATLANPIRSVSTTSLGGAGVGEIIAKMRIDIEAQDWAGVLALAKALDSLVQKYPGQKISLPGRTEPLIAYAQARLGLFDAAEGRVKPMPGDCYVCLRVRGRIAALRGQNARADYWFAQAVKAGPSIPVGYAEWGQSLKERGAFDAAIAKFKLANQKGPHFADPLEMWGEVLIAQNRSDLAIAKFTEANKYAPNWGRLHLKWGEALLWTGKTADAQKQFVRAGEFDLTAAEKSELMKVSGHV